MRIFVRILLLSVVLNLADWPYVDEIFGSAGPVSELLDTRPAAPAQHSGVAKHVQRSAGMLRGSRRLGLQQPAHRPGLAEDLVDVRPVREVEHHGYEQDADEDAHAGSIAKPQRRARRMTNFSSSTRQNAAAPKPSTSAQAAASSGPVPNKVCIGDR